MSKLCKKCKKEFECHPQYPDSELCRECYLKWREKALKCKECKKTIDWHNYYWHAKKCDQCYDSWQIKPTSSLETV